MTSRASAPSRRAVAAAAALFVLACAVSVGGLLDARDWGDVGHYQVLAERIRHGELPYADFFVEYPPAALASFLVPEVFSDYLLAFKLTMVALGLATLAAMVFVLSRLPPSRARVLVAFAVFAIAPVALGHLVLNRYDLLPTALLVAGLAGLIADRQRLGAGLLGLAFAAKVFAAAVVPIVAIRLFRTGGWPAVRRGGTSFAAAAAVCFVPFALLAPGGVGFSLYSQASRSLQAETLGASVLLAIDRVSGYEAELAAGLAVELRGAPADVVGVLTTGLQVAAVLVVAAAYWRGPETTERFVVAFAATVVAFVTFAKVLSPQYLVWLVPLVPLVRPLAGTAASALLVGALVASQAEVHAFEGLSVASWGVWTLLARNVLLVGLFALLLVTLTRRGTVSAESGP